jgi:hypothetical protein
MSDNKKSGNRRRIKDIDKEGLEKILGFYEEKSKNFSRWFALLLGLSVFFFFIIFIPYISTLASHYRISQESNQLQSLILNFTSIQNQIQEFRSNLNGSGQELKIFFEYLMANYTQNLNACRSGTQAVRYIQTAKSEVGQVKEYIQEGSLSDLDICTKSGIVSRNGTTALFFYLNDVTNNLERAYGSFPSQQEERSPALSKLAISRLEYYNSSWHVGSPFWLDLNARSKINSLFAQYHDIFSVINNSFRKVGSEDLTNLEGLKEFNIPQSDLKKQSSETAANLSRGLSELQKTLQELKNQYSNVPENVIRAFKLNPNSETLAKEFNQNIMPKINEQLKNSDPVFINIKRTISGQLESLQNLSGQFDLILSKLKDKENETADRLKQIQFPFGSIPIGINESVSLFPVGLAGGFLVCSLALVDSIRLRKEYYNRKGNGHEKQHPDKIRLITPLWLEPLSEGYSVKLRFMILLLPAIVFAVSVYLLVTSWGIIYGGQEIAGIFVGSNRDNMVLYGGLYVVGTAFLCFAYGRIISEFRGYKSSH